MAPRHQQAARSEFRVPLRRQTEPSIGPKLQGFRCAFVYRPGIRRYVEASLQWGRVRELGEITGDAYSTSRRNFRFSRLALQPGRIAFAYHHDTDWDNNLPGNQQQGRVINTMRCSLETRCFFREAKGYFTRNPRSSVTLPKSLSSGSVN